MDTLKNQLIQLATALGGKIIFSIIAFVVGIFLIKTVKKIIVKVQSKSKLDKTAQNVIKNIIVTCAYLVLALIIIEILGVPMTSVVAVLASCGLAIGLALQGALSNFAGGIMIIIFKPFRVDDYVSTCGVEGTVTDISPFYTHLLTVDNKSVTIPNGTIMNNNVVNFSTEKTRRIDLLFRVTNDIDQAIVKDVLTKAAAATKDVLQDPTPFATLSSVEDDTLIFNVRIWCETAKYWDVYYALMENCTNALRENNIEDPEERMVVRLVNKQ